MRERKSRAAEGLTLVDGARELLRAVDAGIELEEVFVCRSLCRTELGHTVLERLARTRSQWHDVTAAVFARLAFGDRAEGVLGVVRPRPRSLADLPVPQHGLVAVLEGVEKPGNLGAVLRSADAAGVTAVVSADGRTDLFNPAAIRASLGTIFQIPVCEAPAAEVLDWIQARSLRLVAAVPAAAVSHWEVDFTRPTAVVFGSEATGISPRWLRHAATAMTIPMRGAADSLNVAAAAAVVFYEALRQRER